MNKTIAERDIKEVTIDGKKYLEETGKMMMKVSNYGIKTVKGADIAGMSNIPVTFLIDPAKDYTLLSGYLNNKLIPGTEEPAVDSYGDIPTGKNVYDIGRLINNPVILVDHENSASNIAGNFVYLKEDKQGLAFKGIMRPLDEVYCDEVKDAISAWSNGYGVAFSIGGKWLYDWEESDPAENKYILVKAITHEASMVAIGADQWALSCAPNTDHVVPKGDIAPCNTLEEAVSKYLETDDERYIDEIERIKKG